jgi:hypothetical protein
VQIARGDGRDSGFLLYDLLTSNQHNLRSAPPGRTRHAGHLQGTRRLER